MWVKWSRKTWLPWHKSFICSLLQSNAVSVESWCETKPFQFKILYFTFWSMWSFTGNCARLMLKETVILLVFTFIGGRLRTGHPQKHGGFEDWVVADFNRGLLPCSINVWNVWNVPQHILKELEHFVSKRSWNLFWFMGHFLKEGHPDHHRRPIKNTCVAL